MRIGVVGTGWWATQHHLPSLVDYDGAEVVALADPDPGRLAAAGGAFGVDRQYADPHELLRSVKVDGVLIAVPHAFHYELARAAIEAGVHVLVEKPMTLYADEAWDLVHRAADRSVHLMVGYTFQFTAHAAAAREAIQSGRIGELRLVEGLFASMVESYFRGRPADYADVFEFPLTGPHERTYADPAVAGGGQGHTQVTHPMGLALWATGRRASDVFARMANHDLAVDLVDAITFTLEGGAIGTMAATGTVHPGQPQQEHVYYYGSEGAVLHDLSGGRLTIVDRSGTEELEPLTGRDMYPAHAPSRAFVDLIAGHGHNAAPGGPAAATVEFLEAAYRSAREGVVVTIDRSLSPP